MKLSYAMALGLGLLLASGPWACSGDSPGGSASTGADGGGATSTPSSSTGVPPPTSSSGTGGSPGVPGCDAPAVAPSQGYCFLPFATGGGSATSTTTGAATTTSAATATGVGGSAGGAAGGGGAGGGGAGGGGVSGGGASGVGGSAAGGGGASGGEACGLNITDSCNACLAAKCCPEVTVCNDQPNCGPCVGASSMPICTSDPAVAMATAGVNLCALGSCKTECGLETAGGECNPITNAGCSADESCDLSNIGFACFPIGSGGQCDACTPGPTCQPGFHCGSGGACQRYCCDDADCGAGSRCDRPSVQDLSIGLCVRE